jgi:hypothetical protein
MPMDSAQDLHKGGVSPFGHPRINDRSHLPAAFRSVPRPSSPLGAKASTERPSLTHHHAQPSARTQYQTAHIPPGQNTTASITHPTHNTHFHQIHLSKNRPGEDKVFIRGASWKQPVARSEGPARVSPMPSCPKAALQSIERGERSRTIRRVVIKDRPQPWGIRPWRHDAILERR